MQNEFSEDLTIQQAADVLMVSPEYLLGLLNEGKIPLSIGHSGQLVSLGYLLNFQRDEALARRAVLDELTREAQGLDMGY